MLIFLAIVEPENVLETGCKLFTELDATLCIVNCNVAIISTFCTVCLGFHIYSCLGFIGNFSSAVSVTVKSLLYHFCSQFDKINNR